MSISRNSVDHLQRVRVANDSTRARPLISIVIASRNSGGTLEQCLDSILSQQFREWEIVVVDGGSEDSTLDLLRKRGSRINYWQSAKDHGICHAWNTALQHITGQWILFLGADDYLWSAETLERAVPYLQTAYPRHLVVYGNVAAANRNGEIISIIGSQWIELERRMRRTMALPHQGVFHHRSLFKHYGLFDETFRIMGDYEFLSRFIWEHPPQYMPGVTVAAWRQGGMSMQVKNLGTVAAERLRVSNRKNSHRGSPFLSIVYAEEFARMITRLLLGDRVMRRLQKVYRNAVD
jgi:glycosyltransferase involved in cell wall biosynthesis